MGRLEMKPFALQTKITEYDDFASFAGEYQLGADDLILTGRHTYNSVIEKCGLDCHIVLRNNYGEGEPTDEMINAILQDLEKESFGRIIAVGGGTIIDIAKAVAVAEKGDRVDDLYEKGENLRQVHPLFIVPTTCGTGSEVTNISVINRITKGVKMGLAYDALYADTAVLITELLQSLPYFAFATSSIDAMIHAVESYLSPNACTLSAMFSEQALKSIVTCWDKTRQSGEKENWKLYSAELLRASNWAGIAFGYAGCAAVHATSYPLGSVHHIPHGQANQLMFRAVMEKYTELQPVGRINDLEALLADYLGCEPAEALEKLYELMDWILKKDPLCEHGVTEDELPVYAKNVIETQQRLLKNNYIPLTEEQILSIYQAAFR